MIARGRLSRECLAGVMAAALAVLLALALRLYHLPQPSLSYDEAVSAYLALLPLREMLAWTAADVQPPLYYILLQGWTGLAGAGEYSLRFLSVALSVAAVPLLYRLARRLSGRQAGVAAALIAAVHPWYVWHAQDARMYSLLLVVGAAATLALLRWLEADRRQARHSAVLAVAYSLLLYTHYLGAGLIAAHATIVIARSRRLRHPAMPARYLLGVLAPAATLFAPWLPAVVRTMRSDASYWIGALKLDEALRKTFIALFLGGPGETVLEATGLRAAVVLAAALMLALLLRRRRDSLLPLTLLAVTLAVTLAAFAIVPKFNPRYLILVSVPLTVLWGQAAALVGERAPGRQLPSLRQFMGGTALLAVVGGSALGLHGIYADARLTRADFRGAVDYVLDHASPGEPILLVSGHMYPVWRYYAHGVPYVALPEMRVLDVRAALDLGVAPDLAAVLQGATGAWLVLWQDEIADPMGAVTFVLDQAAAGTETGFWHVRVRHYRFSASPPETFEPPPAAGPVCRFEGGMEYLGLLPDVAGNVALLWRADAAAREDLRVQVVLSDEAGHEVMRTHLSPGGDRFPTSQWSAGQTAFVRFAPVTPPAIAGGQYRAALTLYRADSGQALTVLDAAGNPAGQTCGIGSITLSDRTLGVDPAEAVAAHRLQLLDPGPRWPGWSIVAAGACPTDLLPPGAAFALPILLQTDASASAGASLRADLASGGASWELGSVAVPLPPDATAGPYLRLAWLDGRLPAAAPAGQAEIHVGLEGQGGEAPPWIACRVEVTAVTRSFSAVEPRFAADARIADAVDLLGLDAPEDPVSPGDVVRVVLHYRAAVTPAENYTVFVHLVGGNGGLVAAANGAPEGRPTAGWLPGEVVSVELDVAVPAGTPAGTYALETGWFLPDVEGMPRASLTVDDRAATTGSVTVGQLTVR